MSKNYNLSRKDVARILGVCKMHISNLVRDGELHPIDIRTKGAKYKLLRFCSDDIIEFRNRKNVNQNKKDE